MAQEAIVAETELLWSCLAKSDGRAAGKAFTPYFSNSSTTPLSSSFSLLTTLEGEVEELRSCLGRALDFVKARGSSLAGRLDDVPPCVLGAVGLGARQGATMTLLVRELWTHRNLRGVSKSCCAYVVCGRYCSKCVGDHN
jgi:hypothetical protein